MRVLIAPDSFTGSLSAPEAAQAIAAGWATAAPADEFDLAPLSDGGPGFAESMASAIGGTLRPVEITGPTGTPTVGAYAEQPATQTAYIESAQGCGLHLVPIDQRDPRSTTSRGVGELISAAIDRGFTRLVVGLGGTGTCDGGAGLLAALGARAFTADGSDVSHLLARGGGALTGISRLDLEPARARVAGLTMDVATDVDVPLLGQRGAARGFGPQKGATPVQVDELEAALQHWSTLLGRVDVEGVSKDPSVLLGAGAGGGIGAGLLSLGARRAAGIQTVMGAAGIAERAARADLVVTGEGAFDWQSLRGKVVSGVAELANAYLRPVVVLAGRVDVGRREWSGLGISAVYSCVEEAGDPQESLRDSAIWLARTAARAARSWSRG